MNCTSASGTAPPMACAGLQKADPKCPLDERHLPRSLLAEISSYLPQSSYRSWLETCRGVFRASCSHPIASPHTVTLHHHFPKTVPAWQRPRRLIIMYGRVCDAIDHLHPWWSGLLYLSIHCQAIVATRLLRSTTNLKVLRLGLEIPSSETKPWIFPPMSSLIRLSIYRFIPEALFRCARIQLSNITNDLPMLQEFQTKEPPWEFVACWDMFADLVHLNGLRRLFLPEWVILPAQSLPKQVKPLKCKAPLEHLEMQSISSMTLGFLSGVRLPLESRIDTDSLFTSLVSLRLGSPGQLTRRTVDARLGNRLTDLTLQHHNLELLQRCLQESAPSTLATSLSSLRLVLTHVSRAPTDDTTFCCRLDALSSFTNLTGLCFENQTVNRQVTFPVLPRLQILHLREREPSSFGLAITFPALAVLTIDHPFVSSKYGALSTSIRHEVPTFRRLRRFALSSPPSPWVIFIRMHAAMLRHLAVLMPELEWIASERVTDPFMDEPDPLLSWIWGSVGKFHQSGSLSSSAMA